MSDKNFFKEIVEEIFNDLEIKWTELSYGWIYKLEKNGEIKYIKQNMLSLNEIVPSEIVSDKYATYEVLKNNNIPTIEYEMIFNPNKRNKYIDKNISEKIIESFNKYNKLVVIKPNDGNSGNNVFKCKSIKEVEIAIQKIFEEKTSLSICPYYEIEAEYRIVYLFGECLLVFGKYKPYVIGNGINSVFELMQQNNMENFLDKLSSKRQKYIPENNEKIEISWKHNLSEGARVKIVNDDCFKNRLEILAKEAAKAVNINFATIDIAHTENDELKVLEINASVCLTKFKELVENGREISKNIYTKAIKRMFSL